MASYDEHPHLRCYCGTVFCFFDEMEYLDLVMLYNQHVMDKRHQWFDRCREEKGIKAD